MAPTPTPLRPPASVQAPERPRAFAAARKPRCRLAIGLLAAGAELGVAHCAQLAVAHCARGAAELPRPPPEPVTGPMGADPPPGAADLPPSACGERFGWAG